MKKWPPFQSPCGDFFLSPNEYGIHYDPHSVSIPLRGFFFVATRVASLAVPRSGFNPLAGIFFCRLEFGGGFGSTPQVSIPLRGFFFVALTQAATLHSRWFQSPCGDFFLSPNGCSGGRPPLQRFNPLAGIFFCRQV